MIPQFAPELRRRAAARVKRYFGSGDTIAIWNDDRAATARRHGIIPQRASRIEVVQDGPRRGRFYVDFSLLADALGDDSYRVCLSQTYERYDVANAAEVVWLEQNVVDPCDRPC